MKTWSDYEESFLIQNYPTEGIEFCIKNINKNKKQIRSKVQRLGLKLKNDKYDFDNFSKVVSSCINLMDVTRKLGLSKNYGNRQTVKKYIEIYDIDISHFHIPDSNGRKKKSLKELLIKESTYNDTRGLKHKLYKEGLKNRECELCGQGEEWKGRKISLILDHINGINNDNRIENLQIVCPNCNASLDTFCRGSKLSDKYIKKEQKKGNFCLCGKKISINAEKCVECDHKKQRKAERPDIESLIKEVNELGYSATGRKYGVSDNAIRKWIK